MKQPPHAFAAFTRRREPGQTVYIFGAGASASESNKVPTNSTLLESITKQNPVVDARARKRIKSFLEDLHYGLEFPPQFEEVFSLVELALSQNRYFRGWPRDKLTELRTDLLLSAAQILIEGLPIDAAIHSTFVSSLFSNRKISCKNTSFISFNYDITLDQILTANQARAGDIDYGCYFRSFDINYKNEDEQWDSPSFGNELFLLKPHGSFNWVWCPTCNFLRVRKEENIGPMAMREFIECRSCHGPLESLLIPPAWLKNYSNPNVVDIWVRAEFLLTQAEHLVFVGYSLSEADIQVRAALKRAMARSKPKISVVSNQEGTKANDTYVRYRKFFGKVDWFGDGFQEFARRPSHAANSNRS